MKISEFKNLIKAMPVDYQAFDIKWRNWNKFENKKINNIFNEQDIIISRKDIFNENDIETLILKTLMWGYPTKGRGKNIENFIGDKHFIVFCDALKRYKKNNISIEIIKKDMKIITSGLGTSTMTKFLYFLNVKVNNIQTLILDQKIIDTLNANRFDEFKDLKDIKYETVLNKYEDYLKIMNDVSVNINCKPDELEMFLFTFGKILKI
ncbi:MAG: hypothetical protein A2046_05495 [Bacteroidetes bacterium GWA2_30_7]|nr:MAG: hypothetical protein A2046_05495 [Bacteroidetes bacterium GWA2_30_7]